MFKFFDIISSMLLILSMNYLNISLMMTMLEPGSYGSFPGYLEYTYLPYVYILASNQHKLSRKKFFA